MFIKSKWYVLCFLFMIASTFLFSMTQVWLSWEGESYFREMCREWESETGERVELLYVPELGEKLSITLKAGGDLPDICLIKTDNLPVILEHVQPVKTSQIEDMGFEFDPKLVQAFHYQSNDYVFPFYADMQLMYLSTEIFSKLELELPDDNWTFEEYLQMMQVISESNHQPCGWGINSAYIFTGLHSGLGSPLVDQDGKINLLTQKNMNLLTNFKKWYDSGLLTDYVNRPNIVKAFSKGELAMFPQGSFLIQKFQTSGPDFVIRPLPEPWQSVIDPKGFILFNYNENTASLLNLFLRNTETFAKEYIKYPAIAVHHPEQIPYYRQMKKAVDNGIMQPIDDQYVFGYWPAMGTVLDLILKEGVAIKEALEKAQAYIDQR